MKAKIFVALIIVGQMAFAQDNSLISSGNLLAANVLNFPSTQFSPRIFAGHWLKEFGAMGLSTVRRCKRDLRAITGGKWPTDVLRHTPASYLLPKYKDAGKVAYWLGNSPRILLTHYHHPISDADCERFWTI